MTEDQLELMVARTGSGRLRWATSDDNPDASQREWARQWVRDMAAHEAWPPPRAERKAAEPPSLLAKAGNLAKAAATFVKSGLAVVDQAEFDRRHAVCQACPNFDAPGERCKLCGCNLKVKPWGKAMKCPDGRW